MRRVVVGVVALAALSAALHKIVTAEGTRWHANYMTAVEFKGSTHSVAGATPILAVDMYEHSYYLDYGGAAAK
jgi:superoxide dismutase